jgi:hypothetical protein
MFPTTPGQAQPDGAGNGDQPLRPDRLTPVPFTGLPAGAALVAVQNTSIATRTDETGRFTMTGLPADVYLTIAAGPVADSNAAIAVRPNVVVAGGQTTDIGTLTIAGAAASYSNCQLQIGPEITPSEPAAP